MDGMGFWIAGILWHSQKTLGGLAPWMDPDPMIFCLDARCGSIPKNMIMNTTGSKINFYLHPLEV